MPKNTPKLPITKLGDNGLATESGWIMAYCIDPISREYQRSMHEYLSEGVGLPAYSFIDTPPKPKKGYAIVRSADGSTWEQVPDHRGKTAYSTSTKQSQIVALHGKLPDGLTLTTPATEFDVWNGKRWVTDTKAQHQAQIDTANTELAQRRRDADTAIVILEDAVDLAIANAEEKNRLRNWRKYRVLLNRIDPASAPNIDWPQPPQ